MKQFWVYEGILPNGQMVSQRASGGRNEVLAKIQEEGIELVYLRKDWAKVFWGGLGGGRLKDRVLKDLFEDLHEMQQTGMNEQAMLAMVAQTTQDPQLREALSVIKSRIEEGSSLSQAMASTGAFPWIVLSMVKTAEMAGALPQVWETLLESFSRRVELSKRVFESLAYPVCVFILLFGLVLYMGLVVVPKLSDLLPAQTLSVGITGCIVGMSRVMVDYGAVIAFGVCLLFGGFVVCIGLQKDKSLLYSLPILGSMMKESDMADYFHNLSLLLSCGVPLMQAVTDLDANVSNSISQRVKGLNPYLCGGFPFWECIAQDPFFPSVAVLTLRRGEEIGRLGHYMKNLSLFYRKRADLKIRNSIALLQPLLLAAAAGILITIALAFLVPVYQGVTQISAG